MPPLPAHSPAVILAGGSARRLGGGDKPLLCLGGIPIVRRIIDRLDTPTVAINANGDPARFAAFGLPVLDDGPFVDQGPLAGVLAGLDWAAGLGASSLLTVPGDTPFIPRDLMHALGSPPSCAASGQRVHHLVALWPVACRTTLRTFLHGSASRQVSRFTDLISVRPVNFAIDACDPFLNVNTPEDLARARDLMRRHGTGEQR